MRCFVVGGEVVASMQRKAQDVVVPFQTECAASEEFQAALKAVGFAK